MAFATVAVNPQVDVFEIAESYLRHVISLKELHEWMARHTSWLLNQDQGAQTELAGAIELNLAEIELGHGTEEDLIAAIGEFFSWKPVSAAASVITADSWGAAVPSRGTQLSRQNNFNPANGMEAIAAVASAGRNRGTTLLWSGNSAGTPSTSTSLDRDGQTRAELAELTA